MARGKFFEICQRNCLLPSSNMLLVDDNLIAKSSIRCGYALSFLVDTKTFHQHDIRLFHLIVRLSCQPLSASKTKENFRD